MDNEPRQWFGFATRRSLIEAIGDLVMLRRMGHNFTTRIALCATTAERVAERVPMVRRLAAHNVTLAATSDP